MVAVASSVPPAAADQPTRYEPGLPWLTPEVEQHPPLGNNGLKLIWHCLELANNSMAPCFPQGCRVNVAPVRARQNLEVGRAYLYHGPMGPNGEAMSHMARLLSIHSTYLLVQADSARVPAIWPLREAEHEAVWDVWEITHYVSYPLD